MAFARTRILDRLKELEARLRPPMRQFVFFSIEPDPRSRAERLEAFKIENNVGPNDVVHFVTYRFV
jgi:hypothetical protein